MGVSSYEGVVEDGRVRLLDDVRLPENARVYVVVPDERVRPVARIYSPRLVHREDAADFVVERVELPPNADV